MAITSIGYPGSITAIQWAALAPYLGSRYSVHAAADLKVTSVPGSDRTVAVATGAAYGYGVWDSVDGTPQTLQGGVVASGSRWDTVVLRRNWDTSTSSLAILAGTSTRAISASREEDEGQTDDQPLALVQFTAGQQTPTAVVDLRCWNGDGGMVATTTDALAYLKNPGTRVTIDSTTYTCVVTGNGLVEWDLGSTTPVWANLSLAAGWGVFESRTPQASIRDGVVTLRGAITRTGGALSVGSVGGGAVTSNQTVATLPGDAQPTGIRRQVAVATSNGPGSVSLKSAVAVTVTSASSITWNDSAYISLDGVTYTL